MSKLLFRGMMEGMKEIGFLLKEINDNEISFYVPIQAIKDGRINDSIMNEAKQTIEKMSPLKVTFLIQ